ncbi:hypothetical protein E4U52_007973 [Claviceps spartinae]|nr:hypothetical protein E4U52_007973 [Claviceps spartinae]
MNQVQKADVYRVKTGNPPARRLKLSTVSASQKPAENNARIVLHQAAAGLLDLNVGQPFE